MKYGIWKVGSYDEADAKSLQSAGFSPITAAVLCSRGYTSAQSAEEFLSAAHPLSDPMIKFSRCCTPVPGDDIVGFITKGYGVSVHRRDCPNAKNAASPAQSGRWVKVTWAASPEAVFTTSLELEANDRDGLMLDVATILTSLRMTWL